MSTPADAPPSIAAGGFGTLAFRGPDSAKFLQGQLSADLEKLASGTSTLAGLHNPQGRVIALLAVVRTSPEEFLAALPLELVEPVAQRLRKYVLRAKVRIEIPGPKLRVCGFLTDGPPPGIAGIAWAERTLLLVHEGHELLDAPGADAARWELADVRAGMPQVYAATSEQFVAQMLNLDSLGGIAFDKGCYTGQEVIARAHYRGRVKRRMQRWLNESGATLRPGDAARSADGRALAVVRVATLDGGGQEVLAVGNYSPAAEDAAANAAAGTGAGVVVSGPLPLPYSLPE
jgi:folate-binding protein YgfZ